MKPKNVSSNLALMATLFTNSMGGGVPQMHRSSEGAPGTPRHMTRMQFLKRKRKNKTAKMSRRRNRR